jgi:hypothetical protein
MYTARTTPCTTPITLTNQIINKPTTGLRMSPFVCLICHQAPETKGGHCTNPDCGKSVDLKYLPSDMIDSHIIDAAISMTGKSAMI